MLEQLAAALAEPVAAAAAVDAIALGLEVAAAGEHPERVLGRPLGAGERVGEQADQLAVAAAGRRRDEAERGE